MTDIEKNRDLIRAAGITGDLSYKVNIMTVLDIYRDNPWGIKVTTSSSQGAKTEEREEAEREKRSEEYARNRAELEESWKELKKFNFGSLKTFFKSFPGVREDTRRSEVMTEVGGETPEALERSSHLTLGLWLGCRRPSLLHPLTRYPLHTTCPRPLQNIHPSTKDIIERKGKRDGVGKLEPVNMKQKQPGKSSDEREEEEKAERKKRDEEDARNKAELEKIEEKKRQVGAEINRRMQEQREKLEVETDEDVLNR